MKFFEKIVILVIHYSMIRYIGILFIVLLPSLLDASTVTGIKAFYQSGQVFITWKNLKGDQFQYNVYRSDTKITNPSQLNSGTYLGFVRDKSGKNIRKSQLQNQSFYFVVDPASGPLPSNKGLYVVTCTDDQKHFYAVTVTDLLTGAEDKAIVLGDNSLKKGITETKTTPLPVLQTITAKPNGDISYEYVIWGNNQDAESYPAFNNCGSYGYNFTFVNRNADTLNPLYVKFADDDPFETVDSSQCIDCNILQLDDWLPNGNNTFWAGFNTHYNMYSDSNTAQYSGVVRTYTLNRTKQILDWAKTQSTVDANKVYSSGFSHNGFGALFTSIMLPDYFAATQETSAPIAMKAPPGTDREAMWCAFTTDVSSDILNPLTGDTLLIWNIFDLPTMWNLKMNQTLPYMSGVNGKQDVTVGWVQYYHFYDSVDINRQGGAWFWDQRNHSGEGKNFTVNETKLPFTRFSLDKSYPAFTYCSLNGNPGNGDTANGDRYGALNGYLDWVDSTISDKKCKYSINCFVKDFYVGGILQPQFDSCTTDITLRRLQHFKPDDGNEITWKVKNANNKVVQSGSFIYDSSYPITLSGAKIYKTGSTITFKITGCNKELEEEDETPADIKLIRTNNGYELMFYSAQSCSGMVSVTDLLGRSTYSASVSVEAGSNQVSVPMNPGIYILSIKACAFSKSQKVFFEK